MVQAVHFCLPLHCGSSEQKWIYANYRKNPKNLDIENLLWLSCNLKFTIEKFVQKLNTDQTARLGLPCLPRPVCLKI